MLIRNSKLENEDLKEVIVNVRYLAACWCCIIALLLAAGDGRISVDAAARDEDRAAFIGKVVDVQSHPVEGSMVFVYAGTDVRRSADFISPPTGRDGMFHLSLPPGKYWAVARLKKADGFGPLMPGDRHSGEPKEIELAPGSEVEMQFTVTDLREAVIMRTKDREGPVRLSGRIIDEQGAPVKGVYAIACKDEKPAGIPNYVSAWVDNDGHYTLYIPRGSYFIGSAVTFPPGDDVVMDKKITIDTECMDADILRGSVKTDNN